MLQVIKKNNLKIIIKEVTLSMCTLYETSKTSLLFTNGGTQEKDGDIELFYYCTN